MTAENRRDPADLHAVARLASMRPRPMTAENLSSSRRRKRGCGCFNEAAADDRGKPPGAPPKPCGAILASMRPRPMTAENERSRIVVEAERSASMRPRPMTAENAARSDHRPRRRVASMRPRPMTAENARVAIRSFHCAAVASMRPRPMTAENRARMSPMVIARPQLQ